MERIELNTYYVECGPIGISLKTFLKDRNYSSVFVLVDENTQESCLPLIIDSLDQFELIHSKSGEENKDISSCQSIWKQLINHGADRKSLLINLGGGVIGDMGGFCASCYMRGIHFIQIPTTLLSQVDASVGGKLAIDFEGFKNQIGLFNNPQCVLVDSSFLTTLDLRELRSGFAEIIKHGLIRDAGIWRNILEYRNWADIDWNDHITQSIRIKKDVVDEDPYEQGQRKTLNFGHTVGHALESVSHDLGKPLLHGEAIALGMIAESFLSFQKAKEKMDELENISSYLSRVFHDISLETLSHGEAIINRMRGDKKNLKGVFLFSLLITPGSCVFDIEVDPKEVENSLQYVHQAYLSQKTRA